MIPVRLTPSSLSSSVFFFHSSERNLKSVSVDWYVPSIVASSIFFLRVETVSVDLTTTSVRLQNCLSLSIISEHGLHP